jgi:hypothetical protein
MFETIGPIHWLIAASALYAGGCSIETRPPAYYPEQPVVYEAPPALPPAAPVPPPPPSPDQTWIAGHHRWNGHTYVWHEAHYERRPHAHARYVPGHWERRGRGRTWIDAHWD